MNQEKWDNLVINIEEHFEVLEKKQETIMDGTGLVEIISFICPIGKIRLERETKPKFLGRKVLSTKRPGAEVMEELEFSETEKVNRLIAYRFNEQNNAWEEINADQISSISS